MANKKTIYQNDRERFCLRILILNVKNARSYESSRIVNGISYNTIEESTRARNLLTDNSEWYNLMNGAAQTFDQKKRYSLESVSSTNPKIH